MWTPQHGLGKEGFDCCKTVGGEVVAVTAGEKMRSEGRTAAKIRREKNENCVKKTEDKK